MNGVNLQASINSVPQMDRFQQDVNRLPSVNQEQNAAISREQQAQRAVRPEAPEETENKIVDPRENKRNLAEKKKRRRQQQIKNQEEQKNNKLPSFRSGSTIDFRA